ncbi:MAG: dockerin type I repeat-containing protein [Oscillospiraceae bacterium]|nr:dockerin type I repeat-containing protein [Oscillospiraceae bacterium]
MKQMKAMAALLAAVTALLPFAANALTVQNVSAVSAEETGTVSEQKKWLPTDFESAVEFRNTYGATHIADDTVCIVLRKEQEVVLDGNTAFLPRYEVITTKGVMSLSYNTGFGDIDSRYSYEVRLYHPTEPGEFRIALRDNGEETAVYTFAVDNEMHVRETDLCGWLPDCYTEFKDYVKQNGAVSVHENHVVFCQECGVGTAYSWKEADKEYEEYLKYDGIHGCSLEQPVPVEGGSSQTIQLYTAVKEGSAKISWNLGSYALNNPEITETQTADCAVLENAETVLLSDKARIRFEDMDTGALLDFPSAEVPVNLSPEIAFKSAAEGIYAYVDLALRADSNPYFWDIAEFKDADIFQMNLSESQIPKGYTLPEGYVTIRYYDNGAKDIIYRLKKAEAPVKQYSATITLLDRDTGELIPEEILAAHPFQLGTDIRIKNPVNPEEYMMTGPIYLITKNPYTVQDSLAKFYQTADAFSFVCDDQPEVTVHDDGSMDIVFKTKLKVSGDANGDGFFSIADVVALTKWLTGESTDSLGNWANADFCIDNKLTAADLSLMKQKLLAKIAEYASSAKAKPVTINIRRTGGYVGVNEEWNLTQQDGQCILSRLDRRSSAPQPDSVTAEIPPVSYNEIMSLDYDRIIASYDESRQTFARDAFYFNTVITYDNGTEKTTKADMSDIIAYFDKLLEQYREKA